MTVSNSVKIYGTSDPAEALRSFQLGPLSFLFSSQAIRRICWNGTELVRAIAWPIRDESWGTFAPTIIDEVIEANDASFKARLRFSVGDGRLDSDLTVQASADGALKLVLSMTPTDGSFLTNRAGFTVLHPIKGIAGAPLAVTHSSGEVEQTVFPELISPGQPVFDILGLAYDLDGKAAKITFKGDIFEMEDQRNWSDASYKTYCVPLVFPFTYEISKTRTQIIQVSLSGGGEASADAAATAPLVASVVDEAAPEIGLVVEPDWLSGNVVDLSGVGHLRAHIGAGHSDADLSRLVHSVRCKELDVELIVGEDADVSATLARACAKFEGVDFAPKRIIAQREEYLGSIQPSGPWPDGPTPSDVAKAARAAFPDALIGGGMLTNFTEMNRCRPDPAICDFITHANSAIVHAGDDLSVRETLETLPQVFASAQALAGGKPYRLGLVSIGIRTNPYGAELAHNPEQVRYTMAHEDPRQRGLFAAAWSVGVLAATAGQKIEGLCLAAPTGPFGIAYRKQDYPQPYYDDTADAAFYPLFHVVKASAAMAGHKRLHLSGLPDGVHGYGVETDAGPSMIVANVSPEPVTIQLSTPGRAAILDHNSFTDATTKADWLETASRHESTQLELEGFATAFVT